MNSRNLLLIISILIIFFIYKSFQASKVETNSPIDPSENYETLNSTNNKPITEQSADSADTTVDIVQSQTTASLKPTEQRENVSLKYNNLFPELKSYEWLTQDPDYDPKYELPKWKKLLPNKVPGLLLRLIDLKRDNFVTLHGKDFFSRLKIVLKQNEKQKMAFQKGNIIKGPELSNADKVNPICILNISTKNVELPQEWQTFHFFVLGTQTISNEYSGYSGVRIINNINEKKTGANWLESIDCLLALDPASSNKYKEMLFVHLLTTIGVHGTVEEYAPTH